MKQTDYNKLSLHLAKPNGREAKQFKQQAGPKVGALQAHPIGRFRIIKPEPPKVITLSEFKQQFGIK